MLIGNSTLRAGARVIECHNLWPATDEPGAELAVAPMPVKLVEGDFRPLCSDGQRIVVRCDTELYVIDRDDPSNRLNHVAQLTDKALSAVFNGRRLVVSTEHGPWTASLDGEGHWEVEGYEASWPQVAVLADDAGEIAVDVAPEPLEGTGDKFNSNGTEADRKAIGRLIDDAWTRLSDAAAVAGTLIAPVLARARIVDAHGRTLHVYPTLLLRAGAGDLDSSLLFDSADRRTISSRRVAVRSYKVRTLVSGSLPVGTRVVTDISAPFDPWDRDKMPLLSFGREAGSGWLRVSLCPRAQGLSPAHDLNNLAVVRSALSRQSLAAVSGGKTAAFDPALACSVNHSWQATVAGSTATAVVWGNVRPIAFEGWSPLCFATRYERKAWRGWAQVTGPDGSAGVLWQGEGDDYAPVEFGPLLSYPCGGMSAITLCVEVDGAAAVTVHRRLGDSADSRMSFSLESKLSAITPETADESAPQDLDVFVPPYTPHAVRTAPSDAPDRPGASCSLGAKVTAIVAAASPGGAWEYGRQRLYAFTEGGIRLLTLSRQSGETASTQISDLVVSDARLVAAAGSDVIFAHGQSLYRLSGTRIKRVVERLPDLPLAVGYDSLRDEILVAADSTLLHYLPSRDYARYTTDAVAADGWLAARGTVHTLSDGGLMSLTRRAYRDDNGISWVAVVESGDGKRIDLPVYATAFEGAMYLDRSYLDFRRAPLCRLHIDGALRAPLRMVLPHSSVWRPRMAVLTLTGSTPASFRMSKPIIV